jgi:hypothetical protein
MFLPLVDEDPCLHEEVGISLWSPRAPPNGECWASGHRPQVPLDLQKINSGEDASGVHWPSTPLHISLISCHTRF